MASLVYIRPCGHLTTEPNGRHWIKWQSLKCGTCSGAKAASNATRVRNRWKGGGTDGQLSDP